MREGYPLSVDGWFLFALNTITKRASDLYRGVVVLLGYQILLYLVGFMPGGVFLTLLLQLSAGLVLSAGWLNYCLRIARGQKVTVAVILDAFGRFRDVWIVSILLSVFTFAGAIFFIIPGIYIMVRYGLSILVVLDKKKTPVSSFELSSTITEGHRWQLAVLYIITGGLYLMAAFPVLSGHQQIGMVTLFVYNIVITPLISMTLASAYDSLVYANRVSRDENIYD
ncbi:MAG TPA: hypothetical protein VKO43_05380 [Candidatus Krumholzibacteriaceae bacterium]|nr:hypothetical protein [Candidatus Krumholzibacteriaceae bacterium]